MKIVALEGYLLETPTTSYAWREGLPQMGSFSRDLVLRLRTDAEIDGWSRVDYWGRTAIAFVPALREFAVGRDPRQRERMWQDMWEYTHIEKLPTYLTGAIDVALWDIAGKLADMSLLDLLGRYRTEVPAYASTVTFTSLEEYLDVATQCLELGFNAIKLHVWGDFKRDAALCGAVRSHVGDDVELMLDASGAYSYSEAVRMGRVLEEANFRWFEEPMNELAVGPYRDLAATLDIEILGAEASEGAHWTAADWLRTGAVDAVRTGSYYKAGVTGSLKLAHAAEALGAQAEVHGPGEVNRHLACALPNNSYYESIVDSNPVRRSPEVDQRGMTQAPQSPGIGFGLDIADVRARAIQTS